MKPISITPSTYIAIDVENDDNNENNDNKFKARNLVRKAKYKKILKR